MKSFLAASLFLVFCFFVSVSFACDACKSSSPAAGNPHEDPTIKAIRSGTTGEFLFDTQPLPFSQFCFAKLSDVHRMGQVSADVVKNCKCGKPWHTWILKSKIQLQKSKVSQVNTALQNYK